MRTYYRAPRMVPILNGYTNYRAISTKVSVLVTKNRFLLCLAFSCTKQPCFNVRSKQKKKFRLSTQYTYIHTYSKFLHQHASVGLAQARPNDNILKSHVLHAQICCSCIYNVRKGSTHYIPAWLASSPQLDGELPCRLPGILHS